MDIIQWIINIAKGVQQITIGMVVSVAIQQEFVKVALNGMPENMHAFIDQDANKTKNGMELNAFVLKVISG